MTVALVRYEQARTALAECRRIDDAKDIADKAVALQSYARQVRDPDMERWVAEIRLRARRRVGELSAALGTAQGVRGEPLPSAGKKSDALAAAGLSTSEAHRCEQIAKVPVARFETYIATQTAAGKTVTADEVVAKTAREQKRRDREERRTNVIDVAAAGRGRARPRISKANKRRIEAIDEARARGVSMFSTYARLTLTALHSQTSFSDEERLLIADLAEAIQKVSALQR